jgi:hypothetical protein
VQAGVQGVQTLHHAASTPRQACQTDSTEGVGSA